MRRGQTGGFDEVTALIATRGLPGSGKTTWAKRYVAKSGDRAVRVNRDDLRVMLHGAASHRGATERQVTAAQHALIRAQLDLGVTVVVDDTNLRARYLRELRDLARRSGADFEVRDFTSVPLEDCVARDAAREEPVGEGVIRDLWRRYLAGRELPLPVPPASEPERGQETTGRPYHPRRDRPAAVMCDLDGTVALVGDRSPYDESRVESDQPNPAVIAALRGMHATGHRVLFCSGRTSGSRGATERWLARHVDVPHDLLLMREPGDRRKDAVVKLEMFDREIRDHYRVVFVLDDRDQVVRLWRGLGLTVMQVAEGDF
ncbi:AAA family ATPase [Actinoalloteichus caeruleus]|uniref:phosphatase domain-containing protein n=1 Tax=Actinoalloteichus cyanogriseus TaxID=2893586 RepID=UPI003BB8AF8C